LKKYLETDYPFDPILADHHILGVKLGVKRCEVVYFESSVTMDGTK